MRLFTGALVIIVSFLFLIAFQLPPMGHGALAKNTGMTKQKAIEWLKKSPTSFRRFPEELRDDEELALLAIELDETLSCMQHMSPRLREKFDLTKPDISNDEAAEWAQAISLKLLTIDPAKRINQPDIQKEKYFPSLRHKRNFALINIQKENSAFLSRSGFLGYTQNKTFKEILGLFDQGMARTFAATSGEVRLVRAGLGKERPAYEWELLIPIKVELIYPDDARNSSRDLTLELRLSRKVPTRASVHKHEIIGWNIIE